jgi:hypothetical protein
VRRLKNSSSESFGGLAGWLFADVAIVLAIALATSQVIRQPEDDGAPPEPVPTTQPPPTESTPATDSQQGSVDVREIVLSDVCVSDPTSLPLAELAIEERLREQKVSSETQFGVLLVYAGYRGDNSTDSLIDQQDRAKGRAEAFRDMIKQWDRLGQERWVKDLGHDGGTDINCYKLYLLRELKSDR